MKPIYLSIKGLNSFSEPAEIDFTKLTQSGIFGIFGDTGSGKSTILDGINFALYGDVGRSKEKTDIINYKCDSVEVKFTFNVLTDGERKNYTVERSIKRKSGTHKAVLYEEVDGVSLQIADNASSVKQKIIDIIGVSAEDFRKCIALPQGEFAEFVQSEPRKRIELIERLFDLSKYGEKLKDKLSALLKKTENEYQKISGEMAAYEDVSDNAIKQIETQIKSAKKLYFQFESERESSLKKYNEVKALYSDRLRLDDAQNKLSKLNAQSTEMEKLRQSLKLLPICRRVCDEEDFALNSAKKITAEQARVEDIEKSLKTTQISANQAEQTLKTFNYEHKLAEISGKSAKLSADKAKFENLEDIRAKLKETQLAYENLKKQREEQGKKTKLYQEKLESLKSEYKALPVLKIENLISDDVKKSIMREAYVNEFNFICELRENIKEYKSDTKLYNFVMAELTQRINYLEEIVRGTAANKTDVGNRIKEFQKNYEYREKLSERITNGETALSDCRRELSVLDEKLNQKLAESKERSDNFQQIFGELCNEYGSKPNYSQLQLSLAGQKKKVDGEYEDLKTQVEKLNSKLTALGEEKKNALKYIGILTDETKARRLKIDALLAESGFKTVQQCKNLLDEFGDFDSANKHLDEYDKLSTSYKAIVEQYKNTEGIHEITEENVNQAKNYMLDCEKNLRDKNAEIKVCENNLNVIREKLAKKNEISKQLKQVTEHRNLVGQLDSLIRGNNFMKFVADGHLSDISKVASKMLLDLTDGRYFLVYKDGFFVGDNFNGGEQRGVNTLSGGETFLVSLSLALSLSSVICAKSNKDIEFFFLDEGFGTLDETLIEVVMSALEKLKNSHFTIGIISHVEELKHRIESKIIVNKATESHGSTLTLSC